MTATSCADRTTPDLEPFARQALDHFEREETFLHDLHEELREIHTALVANDHPALHAALERQTELEHRREDLRRVRADFCRHAAAVLGVAAADIRLGLVAERLTGESAVRLRRQRDRLGGKVREVDQLRHQITSLAQHCLGFWNNFFLELIGAGGDGRYSAAGTRSDSTYGSFIKVRG